MRQLNLHVSALNDAEYDLYISSLNDLAVIDSHEQKRPHNDAYYEGLTVGVREARAWLRGRYGDVPVSDIDTILRFFHPDLGQTDCLTGGQFFAALRLVLHAEAGKNIDKGLAFVQAHPETVVSRPPSPPKKKPSQYLPPPPSPARPQSPPKRQSYQHPPPPTPARHPIQRAITSISQQPDTNPFHHLSIDSQTPVQQPPNSSHPTVVIPAATSNHNPFLARAKSLNAKGDARVEGKIPPLPPRKPAPLVAPTRHTAQLLSAPPPASTSAMRPAPLLSAPAKPAHITSPLMRQSLQASKAAQTMKKAEEQLEQERVLEVLKSSSVTSVERGRSISPPKRVFPGPVSSSSSEERKAGAPRLPRRRIPSPQLSSMGSNHSFEEVAGATLPTYHTYKRSTYTSPFRPAAADREPTSSPFSGSPTLTSTDLPPASASSLPAPPTHPDRRPSALPNDSPDSNWPPATISPRRSKSMHHPTPPPVPPPRHKRPESVQLTSTDTSPFSSPQPPRSATLLSRHLSFTVPPGAPDTSPMANIQRTLVSLHNKAQPKFDAARYKAEAGLSRRGYVNHSQYSGRWVEEGEEGLMTDERRRSVDDGVDQDRLSAVVMDEDASSEEEKDVRGARRVREDFNSADNLKWPAGDGWNPL